MPASQISGLTADELSVEYLLRKINPTDSNARQELVIHLKEEESDPSLIPTECHTENVKTEFTLCKSAFKILNSLKMTLTENGAPGDLKDLRNRISHWQSRTLRLKGRFVQDNEVDKAINEWRRLRLLVEKWLEDRAEPTYGYTPIEKNEEGATALSPQKMIKPVQTTPPREKIISRPTYSTTDFNRTTTKPDNTQELCESIRKIWEFPSTANNNRPVDNKILDSPIANDNPNMHYPSYYSLRREPKWNISFKGNTTSLEINDFLFRFESLAKRDRILDRDLDSLLPRFLKETAEKWFWVYIRKNPEASYPQIRAAMVQRFSGYDTEREVRRMIENRKQRAKEPFNDFVLDLESLNCQLTASFSERELIEIIRDNMDPMLQNATLTLPISTVEGMRQICQRFEKLWAKTGTRNLPGRDFRRQFPMNELDTPSEWYEQSHNYDSYPPSSNNSNLMQTSTSDYDQIHAIRTPKLPPRTSEYLICWNCQDLGHRYQDCSMPPQRIFCYGCGAANIIKPQCIKCQARATGNVMTVAPPSGSPRPKITKETPNNSKSVSQTSSATAPPKPPQ